VQNLFENMPEKKRILCVENHEDTCELISLILSDYEVIFSKTITNSIELFKTQSFNLCILDSLLDDGHGLNLCQQILALNSKTPIIFASGVAQTQEIEKALEAGAKAYLVKPYNLDELQQIVKELINRDGEK
jgi:DNA-binding response OmpR family regulator